ncbi:MAG TPA: septum formation initiator family protein [Chloroflexota bacterium]|jgi:cell division protein FtsB|nr:septum formation initiator family protein [Chloroflexota bacterium]
MAFLRQISPMQILLLLVLTVALYFAAALAGELIASQRIDQQVTSLNHDIGVLKTQNQQLTAQVGDAKSDAFVERQARDMLGLVKPGDYPVVVVNAPAPPPPAPPPAAPKLAHWQVWAKLLGLSPN